MIFCINGGKACPWYSVPFVTVRRSLPAVEIDFYLIPGFDLSGRLRTLNDRKSDIDRITVKNTCKCLCNNTAYSGCLYSIIGACSLDEPHPKFLFATMISPSFAHCFTKSLSISSMQCNCQFLRDQKNLEYLAGMMTSVSTLSPYLNT